MFIFRILINQIIHSLFSSVKKLCLMFCLQEHDKPKILGTGLCMVTVGIALIIITNVINNHEKEKIMNYLVRFVIKCRMIYANLVNFEVYLKVPVS